MPTPTYTPLATVTLGTTAASVTFSSIPATYRDLIVVFEGSTTSDAFGFMRFNGDSGGNYSYVRMNSSPGSDSASGSSSSLIAEIRSPRGNVITQIMDYSATDKHKTLLARSNEPGITIATASRWGNTAAITSVQMFVGSSFTSGSNFALYGVIA
jgi:hypothetical protein